MSERFGSDLLLVEKLAAGGMAEVHRAKQLGYGGFEKWVAVKRILQNFAANEEFKAMFRMEANLCAQLQHPNIVHVFGNGDFDGYLYLVMEFVDGRNLRQVLARADKKKVKIPIEIACHLVAEAAKGLEYAHNFVDEKTGQPMEVVHRDMSPQNIMLSYDGNVKVVDFGIAKAASRAENTRAGVLKGKFGYMSPEQASGLKIDRRTDIFALGIILFETLTQRRLFTCDDDLRTLQLVKDCRVPRPSKYNPGIGPGLDRIVMKALAKERGERYATAGELYADLLRFMNQKYPKFLPMELASFLKKIFGEDIAEEKKKREKWAAEAPPRMASHQSSRASGQSSDDKDHTHVDDDEAKTKVSGMHPSPFEEPLPNPTEFEAPQPDLPDASDSFSGANDDEATQLTGEMSSELPLPQAQALEQAAFPSGGPSQLSLSVPANLKNQNPPLDGTRLTVGTYQLPDADLVSRARAGNNYGNVTQSMGMPISKSSQRKRVYMYAGAALVLFVVVAVGGAGNAPVSEDAPVAQSAVDSQSNPVDVGDPVAQQSVAIPPAAPDLPALEPTTPEAAAPETAASENPVAANPAPVVPVEETRDPAAIQHPGFETKPATKLLAGYLSLSSTPRATEIYLDGKLMVGADGAPMQTPLTRHELPTGRHILELRNPVFGVRHSETIEISQDRILTRDLVLSGSLNGN